MTPAAPVSPAVVAALADNLDGWVENFYTVTHAIASAVADGTITGATIRSYPLDGSYPAHRSEALAAAAGETFYADDHEAVGVAVDAIVGLAAGSAVIGDEARPGRVYTWYFDDAEDLTRHGTTIQEFRRQTRTLTIRQAAAVLVAAFDHLRHGRG